MMGKAFNILEPPFLSYISDLLLSSENSLRWILPSQPLYSWGNGKSDEFNNLPKIIIVAWKFIPFEIPIDLLGREILSILPNFKSHHHVIHPLENGIMHCLSGLLKSKVCDQDSTPRSDGLYSHTRFFCMWFILSTSATFSHLLIDTSIHHIRTLSRYYDRHLAAPGRKGTLDSC